MIRLLQKATEFFTAILLSAVVIVVILQVLGRYVFEISLSWPEELARYLLVWLVFIGAAATVGAKEQLVVDTLSELGSTQVKRAVLILGILGSLAGVIVLLNAAMPLFGPASRTVSPATNIPMGWVYLSLPVGGVLSAIFLADALWRAVTGRPDDTSPSGPAL